MRTASSPQTRNDFCFMKSQPFAGIIRFHSKLGCCENVHVLLGCTIRALTMHWRCFRPTCCRISESLDSNRPSSFEDCISWARLQFQQRFHNEIAQVRTVDSTAPSCSGYPILCCVVLVFFDCPSRAGDYLSYYHAIHTIPYTILCYFYATLHYRTVFVLTATTAIDRSIPVVRDES